MNRQQRRALQRPRPHRLPPPECDFSDAQGDWTRLEKVLIEDGLNDHRRDAHRDMSEGDQLCCAVREEAGEIVATCQSCHEDIFGWTAGLLEATKRT